LDGIDRRRIFEIGFFEGGMPLFLYDMVDAGKIVGIDRHPPPDTFRRLTARLGLTSQIKLYGGVAQNDFALIKQLIDHEFAGDPLDIIIDDCSHEYQNTKRCFEELFGYLRVGGKYLIEDWGWLHWPGHPWQTRDNPFYGQPPLTNLVFELIMVHASNPDVISRVDVVCNSLVVVTRGPGLGHQEKIDIGRSYLTAGKRAPLFGGGSRVDWS
jgi:hypothetical protein